MQTLLKPTCRSGFGVNAGASFAIVLNGAVCYLPAREQLAIAAGASGGLVDCYRQPGRRAIDPLR